MRLCVDGPVLDADQLDSALVPGRGTDRSGAMTVEFCGTEFAHPIINASGTFDAIAARRAFGDALILAFPSPASSPRR